MSNGSGRAWAVIPAGGSGQRFSPDEDKLLMSLAGRPVLVHSVLALLSAKSIQGAVVAARLSQIPAYQAALASVAPSDLCGKPVQFVPGGDTRRDSVRRGLAAVPAYAETIVVHDAARPLIRPAIIDEAVRRVQETPGASALVAIAVYDTVKDVDPSTGRVLSTVDRQRLWRAQTPQVFPRSVLQQAHERVAADCAVTDDVQLVEMAGLGEVFIVEGEVRNLKITTPEDILVAEALLGD